MGYSMRGFLSSPWPTSTPTKQCDALQLGHVRCAALGNMKREIVPRFTALATVLFFILVSFFVALPSFTQSGAFITAAEAAPANCNGGTFASETTITLNPAEKGYTYTSTGCTYAGVLTITSSNSQRTIESVSLTFVRLKATIFTLSSNLIFGTNTFITLESFTSTPDVPSNAFADLAISAIFLDGSSLNVRNGQLLKTDSTPTNLYLNSPQITGATMSFVGCRFDFFFFGIDEGQYSRVGLTIADTVGQRLVFQAWRGLMADSTITLSNVTMRPANAFSFSNNVRLSLFNFAMARSVLKINASVFRTNSEYNAVAIGEGWMGLSGGTQVLIDGSFFEGMNPLYMCAGPALEEGSLLRIRGSTFTSTSPSASLATSGDGVCISSRGLVDFDNTNRITRGAMYVSRNGWEFTDGWRVAIAASSMSKFTFEGQLSGGSVTITNTVFIGAISLGASTMENAVVTIDRVSALSLTYYAWSAMAKGSVWTVTNSAFSGATAVSISPQWQEGSSLLIDNCTFNFAYDSGYAVTISGQVWQPTSGGASSIRHRITRNRFLQTIPIGTTPTLLYYSPAVGPTLDVLIANNTFELARATGRLASLAVGDGALNFDGSNVCETVGELAMTLSGKGNATAHVRNFRRLSALTVSKALTTFTTAHFGLRVENSSVSGAVSVALSNLRSTKIDIISSVIGGSLSLAWGLCGGDGGRCGVLVAGSIVGSGIGSETLLPLLLLPHSSPLAPPLPSATVAASLKNYITSPSAFAAATANVIIRVSVGIAGGGGNSLVIIDSLLAGSADFAPSVEDGAIASVHRNLILGPLEVGGTICYGGRVSLLENRFGNANTFAARNNTNLTSIYDNVSEPMEQLPTPPSGLLLFVLPPLAIIDDSNSIITAPRPPLLVSQLELFGNASLIIEGNSIGLNISLPSSVDLSESIAAAAQQTAADDGLADWVGPQQSPAARRLATLFAAPSLFAAVKLRHTTVGEGCGIVLDANTIITATASACGNSDAEMASSTATAVVDILPSAGPTIGGGGGGEGAVVVVGSIAISRNTFIGSSTGDFALRVNAYRTYTNDPSSSSSDGSDGDNTADGAIAISDDNQYTSGRVAVCARVSGPAAPASLRNSGSASFGIALLGGGGDNADDSRPHQPQPQIEALLLLLEVSGSPKADSIVPADEMHYNATSSAPNDDAHSVEAILAAGGWPLPNRPLVEVRGVAVGAIDAVVVVATASTQSAPPATASPSGLSLPFPHQLLFANATIGRLSVDVAGAPSVHIVVSSSDFSSNNSSVSGGNNAAPANNALSLLPSSSAHALLSVSGSLGEGSIVLVRDSAFAVHDVTENGAAMRRFGAILLNCSQQTAPPPRYNGGPHSGGIGVVRNRIIITDDTSVREEEQTENNNNNNNNNNSNNSSGLIDGTSPLPIRPIFGLLVGNVCVGGNGSAVLSLSHNTIIVEALSQNNNNSGSSVAVANGGGLRLLASQLRARPVLFALPPSANSCEIHSDAAPSASSSAQSVVSISSNAISLRGPAVEALGLCGSPADDASETSACEPAFVSDLIGGGSSAPSDSDGGLSFVSFAPDSAPIALGISTAAAPTLLVVEGNSMPLGGMAFAIAAPEILQQPPSINGGEATLMPSHQPKDVITVTGNRAGFYRFVLSSLPQSSHEARRGLSVAGLDADQPLATTSSSEPLWRCVDRCNSVVRSDYGGDAITRKPRPDARPATLRMATMEDGEGGGGSDSSLIAFVNEPCFSNTATADTTSSVSASLGNVNATPTLAADRSSTASAALGGTATSTATASSAAEFEGGSSRTRTVVASASESLVVANATSTVAYISTATVTTSVEASPSLSRWGGKNGGANGEGSESTTLQLTATRHKGDGLGGGEKSDGNGDPYARTPSKGPTLTPSSLGRGGGGDGDGSEDSRTPTLYVTTSASLSVSSAPTPLSPLPTEPNSPNDRISPALVAAGAVAALLAIGGPTAEFHCLVIVLDGPCTGADDHRAAAVARYLLAPFSFASRGVAVLGSVGVVALTAAVPLLIVAWRCGGVSGWRRRTKAQRRAALRRVCFPAAPLTAAFLLYAGVCFNTLLILREPSIYLRDSSRTAGEAALLASYAGWGWGHDGEGSVGNPALNAAAIAFGLLFAALAPTAALACARLSRADAYVRRDSGRQPRSLWAFLLCPDGSNSPEATALWGPAVSFARPHRRCWGVLFPWALILAVAALATLPVGADGPSLAPSAPFSPRCRLVHAALIGLFVAAAVLAAAARAHRLHLATVLSTAALLSLALLAGDLADGGDDAGGLIIRTTGNNNNNGTAGTTGNVSNSSNNHLYASSSSSSASSSVGTLKAAAVGIVCAASLLRLLHSAAVAIAEAYSRRKKKEGRRMDGSPTVGKGRNMSFDEATPPPSPSLGRQMHRANNHPAVPLDAAAVVPAATVGALMGIEVQSALIRRRPTAAATATAARCIGNDYTYDDENDGCAGGRCGSGGILDGVGAVHHDNCTSPDAQANLNGYPLSHCAKEDSDYSCRSAAPPHAHPAPSAPMGAMTDREEASAAEGQGEIGGGDAAGMFSADFAASTFGKASTAPSTMQRNERNGGTVDGRSGGGEKNLVAEASFDGPPGASPSPAPHRPPESC